MSGSPARFDEVRDIMPDGPMLIEDLLSQLKFHAGTDGDPAVIADLWTQA